MLITRALCAWTCDSKEIVLEIHHISAYVRYSGASDGTHLHPTFIAIFELDWIEIIAQGVHTL